MEFTYCIGSEGGEANEGRRGASRDNTRLKRRPTNASLDAQQLHGFHHELEGIDPLDGAADGAAEQLRPSVLV
jgi:hypothetical protein